jgi:hypothetical protein
MMAKPSKFLPFPWPEGRQRSRPFLGMNLREVPEMSHARRAILGQYGRWCCLPTPSSSTVVSG